jgi:predicted acylesterase/phospholipase RssA
MGRAGRLLSAALLVVLLAGCTQLTRLPAPPAEVTETLPVVGIANGRFWPDNITAVVPEEVRLAALRREPSCEVHMLALSGGGDNGAFGAGLMIGWTQRGDRPRFDVVTGISAGALIAPFAFLGPDYDDELTQVFTDVAPTDVLLRWRISLPFQLLFGQALADTSPLYDLIARHADEAMLAAIAREYLRGRLLLIGTTNLDLQRPVVWNIGAIAASGHPGALRLFRGILLASASIPGAFPPVMIEAEHEGRRFHEMHVDGGASMQVFLYPPYLEPTGLWGGRRTVHVVRNGPMQMEAETTRLGVFSITRRSASTLLHFSGVGDIQRMRLLAQRDAMSFRLAHVATGFEAERREPFDTGYMRALFEHGRLAGLNGAWAEWPAPQQAGCPAQPRNVRPIRGARAVTYPVPRDNAGGTQR